MALRGLWSWFRALFTEKETPPSLRAHRDRRKKLGLPHKMSNKLSILAAAEIRVPDDLISGQLNAN